MTPLELVAYFGGTLLVYHYAVVKGLIPGAASAALNLIRGKAAAKPPAAPAVPATGLFGGALQPLEDPLTAAIMQQFHLGVGGIGQDLIRQFLGNILGNPTVVHSPPATPPSAPKPFSGTP